MRRIAAAEGALAGVTENAGGGVISEVEMRLDTDVVVELPVVASAIGSGVLLSKTPGRHLHDIASLQGLHLRRHGESCRSRTRYVCCTYREYNSAL